MLLVLRSVINLRFVKPNVKIPKSPVKPQYFSAKVAYFSIWKT